MIARKSDCNPRQLSALLGDTLDDLRQAAVTQHLDHCAHCRQQLEALAASEEWWDDARLTLSGWQSDSAAPLTTQAQAAIGPGGQVDASAQPPQQHWVLGLLQPPSDPHALGEIDGMSIEAVVGQGGMGVVLKARDQRLQRFLAVKLLSPMLAGSGAARQRFFREARAAAAVVHPNIVPIYTVSAERSLPYLVMPYVAGGNLQEVVDEEGSLPLDRSLSVGLQVAEGLAAAHRQGIVHRDIKPANLMLDEGGFRILITDFGLARALDDATLTGSGLLAGTPQYMSPEQARGGSIDHRTDIYSLGAVLYALATGRAPVRGDSTFDILRRIGEEPPKPILEINENYPAWYQRLVQYLMSPAVADRPQSAESVAELLRSALAHCRAPHHVPLPPQLRRTRRLAWDARLLRSPLGKLAAAGALAACVGIVAAIPWPQFISTQHDAQRSIQAHGQREVPAVRGPQNVASASAGPLESWHAPELERLLDASEQELGSLAQEIGIEVAY